VPPAVAARLPRLFDLLEEGRLRSSPYQAWWSRSLRDAGVETAFRGSYDRHSNVAAHWALLVEARLRDDAAARERLVARFDAAWCEAERRFVAASHSRSPVRPYEQTWLYLFLGELERARPAEDAPRLREFRADVAGLLLADAETAPWPPPEFSAAPATRPASSRPAETRPRRAAPASGWVSGAYPSLVWATTVLCLDPPDLPEHAARLQALVRERLAVVAPRLRRETPENLSRGIHGFDFFHAGALAALAERAAAVRPAAPAGAYVPFDLPAAEPLPAPITLQNCHRLGFEAVKLWPTAFDAGRGDADARAAYGERLAEFLACEPCFDGAYLTVSHWVPQFLVFGVWLAAGRP
jgi:hypothetical protein